MNAAGLAQAIFDVCVVLLVVGFHLRVRVVERRSVILALWTIRVLESSGAKPLLESEGARIASALRLTFSESQWITLAEALRATTVEKNDK